jgi:hypothetical protein
MRETQAELDALQRLLDRSRAQATEHLRGIINDRRTLSAADITALLTGMKVVSLATVTARGEQQPAHCAYQGLEGGRPGGVTRRPASRCPAGGGLIEPSRAGLARRAVSTYCWKLVTLPSRAFHTWQTRASRLLPVCL